MDALGPLAAERATCRDPTRPKGEGDRGSNRIEVPGFEPNAAVRQKAREKVHPPLFGDPALIIKIGQEPLGDLRTAAAGWLPHRRLWRGPPGPLSSLLAALLRCLAASRFGRRRTGDAALLRREHDQIARYAGAE